MHRFFLAAATGLTVLATSAPAQTFLNGNHSIGGRLCVGDVCTASEGFSASDSLKLQQNAPGLFFNDTSVGNFPQRDWRLVINDGFSGGSDYFALQDVTAGRQVFRMDGSAPASALHVDGAGELGLGTSLPQREIHMKGGDVQTVRFETDTSEGKVAQTWDILSDRTGLSFFNQIEGTEVVRFAPSGENARLVVNNQGNVGLGLFGPTATLHLARADGSAQIKVENSADTTSARTLLDLQNNGRPEIVMGNIANNAEWSFGAGTKFILKQGTLGSASSAKTKLFEIDPSGNAILQGTLTTGGTTCGGGCDRVFTERAVIPAAEYHAQMWTQGFLPHVGPTPEDQPFDLTHKVGGMLNALEHAHVYIQELRDEVAALKATVAQLQTP